jgi:sphingomyelin phosphodiesterase
MAIDSTIRSQVITKSLEEFGVLVCQQIETANNTVCPGAVTEMGDIIVPVLANFLLSPDYVCSRILSMCDPIFKELDQNDFVKRVLADKPEHLMTNDFVDKMYESIKKASSPRKTFLAAHFSDVHVDMYYKAGTNKNCNMPLCCREENGYPADPADAAGVWGEYNCDTAPAALTKMFEYLRDEVHPDVLFWTGDMSAHSVWENSVQEVTDVNNYVARQIQEMFGDKL